jgi:hypothetical protein
MNYIKQVFVRGLGWRDLEEIMDNNFTVRTASQFKFYFPMNEMERVRIHGITFIKQFNDERSA